MERKNWINKLDELEGDKPASPKNNIRAFDFGSSPEHIAIYGLAGAVAFILILVVVLFFRTGKDMPAAGLEDVYARLETLESQLSRLESREEERQNVYVQLMQSEQEVKSRLDLQREGLDDLRQQIAELDKAPPISAPSPAASASPPVQKEPEPEVASRPGAETDKLVHEVQRGENLFRIGLKYNISVDEIQRLNGLSPNDSIHPGQKLVVGTKNN